MEVDVWQGGKEVWRCECGMPAGNEMKNVGGIANFNCRVKKKGRNIKHWNNQCVEETVGVICAQELSAYRLHLPEVNIGFMYIW